MFDNQGDENMNPLNAEVSGYFEKLGMHKFALSASLETHHSTIISYMRIIEKEAIKQKNVEVLQALWKDFKGYDKH